MAVSFGADLAVEVVLRPGVCVVVEVDVGGHGCERVAGLLVLVWPVLVRFVLVWFVLVWFAPRLTLCTEILMSRARL